MGAGHSNLYVCAPPRDITNDADVPGVSRTDLTRCNVYAPTEPVGATGTALHWLKLGRHNVVQLAIVTFHRCRCWANRSLPSRSVSAEGKRRRTGVPTLEHLSDELTQQATHSAHVDAMRDVLTQQATQINELAQHNHNSIISFQKRTRQNA